MDSILKSIKKLLNVADDYFDSDIIMHINSVFMTLNQLGVGPERVFAIEDESALWTDFIPDVTQVQAIKSYMFLQVKILFDSASLGAATLAAYERQIQQFEFRLNVAAESSVQESDGEEEDDEDDWDDWDD